MMRMLLSPPLLSCREELERPQDIAHLILYFTPLRHHVYFQNLVEDVSAEACEQRMALSQYDRDAGNARLDRRKNIG